MGRGGTARPPEAEWSSGVASFLGGYYNQNIFKDPKKRHDHDVSVFYNNDLFICLFMYFFIRLFIYYCQVRYYLFSNCFFIFLFFFILFKSLLLSSPSRKRFCPQRSSRQPVVTGAKCHADNAVTLLL